MQKKTGVLLIQLGTPDAPSTFEVGKYLAEFLGDPRVVDLPWLPRKLLVNGVIVPFRSPRSAKVYRKLWQVGGGRSPLLTHSEAICRALNERFADEPVEVEMAMRYRHPSMDQVIERMRQANYQRIIVLPLFPQYASASTGSAIERALKLIGRWWVVPELEVITHFHHDPAYIDAVAAQADGFPLAEYDHLLFSYHGLPVRHLDKVHQASNWASPCDGQRCERETREDYRPCYKAACYETSRLLAERLGLDESRYTVCFQSRLNRRWMQPFADEVIKQLAQKGARRLLVFSPAFVSDCLETLIEIGEEYQAEFAALGGERVQLVPSVNDTPRFIDSLEGLVRARLVES